MNLPNILLCSAEKYQNINFGTKQLHLTFSVWRFCHFHSKLFHSLLSLCNLSECLNGHLSRSIAANTFISSNFWSSMIFKALHCCYTFQGLLLWRIAKTSPFVFENFLIFATIRKSHLRYFDESSVTEFLLVAFYASCFITFFYCTDISFFRLITKFQDKNLHFCLILDKNILKKIS